MIITSLQYFEGDHHNSNHNTIYSNIFPVNEALPLLKSSFSYIAIGQGSYPIHSPTLNHLRTEMVEALIHSRTEMVEVLIRQFIFYFNNFLDP